jgi:integrase
MFSHRFARRRARCQKTPSTPRCAGWGYSGDQMTAHGFRSMASTLLSEQGWNRDAIERQLAHGERDEVRAAYNYAQYLPERRKMMQSWSDFLDGLRAGDKVVPLKMSA